MYSSSANDSSLITYLEFIICKHFNANVSQLSVKVSISCRTCNHASRFWGPIKPEKF